MLSIVEPLTIPGGTAYIDDEDWSRYYIVPGLPAVRRRADGTPVFLLVAYEFGDDARLEDPDLPRGAGYLQFDVHLALDEATAQQARTALQARVDAEHARRHGNPAYAADPLAQSALPPSVVLSDPLWSGGSVKLQTTQSESLVAQRLAEQPAAMLTGNNASFNLDLTGPGLAFFKELLVTDAGTGRVDLAAVAVLYELKMWARLPPFKVTLEADSTRLQSLHESARQTNRDDVCTPNEVETFQERGFSAASLQAAGAITFHTDAPPGVPPEAVQAVRDYAYQLFDSMVRDQFLQPVDAAGAPLSLEDVEPRPRGRRILPVDTRLKLRDVQSTSNFAIRIELTQSQMVEWPVAPGSTLEPVFAGLPASQMQKHVVQLTLDSFRARPVTVRAFADYRRIAAVQVDLEYSGVGDDGRSVVKQKSFTFTGANPGPSSVDWTQLGTARAYRYRYKTFEVGSNRESPWAAWKTAAESELNLSVLEPGRIELDITAAALDWTLVKSCIVGLTATGADARVWTHTLQLTATATAGRWEVALGTDPQGPVQATFTYTLADGRVFGPRSLDVEPTQNLLVVPGPQLDVLNVALVPGGDWSEVAAAVVVMKYTETDGTVKDDTFRFTTVEQFAEWKVPLRDPTRRSFTWEVTIGWKTDRPPERRAPVAATGDQTISIVVRGRPRLAVTVNPALLDFTQVLAVQVNLTSASGATTSCAFSKGATNTPFAWSVPLADGAPEGWSWETIWFPADGPEVRSGVQPGAGNLLLVPKLERAQPSAWTINVRGNFIDFAATPLVTVELTYTSAHRSESRTIELSPEARSGSWALTLAADEPRRHHYAITYFLPDGTPVPGETGPSEAPLLVIKAYKPTP